MNEFGQRVRELRKSQGHTLRSLAPLVGVGFTYLSKVESGKLGFSESPSADLIIRIAKTLDADADELMLMAGRIPDSIAERILEQPDAFLALAKCSNRQLLRLVSEMTGS